MDSVGADGRYRNAPKGGTREQDLERFRGRTTRTGAADSRWINSPSSSSRARRPARIANHRQRGAGLPGSPRPPGRPPGGGYGVHHPVNALDDVRRLLVRALDLNGRERRRRDVPADRVPCSKNGSAPGRSCQSTAGCAGPAAPQRPPTWVMAVWRGGGVRSARPGRCTVSCAPAIGLAATLDRSGQRLAALAMTDVPGGLGRCRVPREPRSQPASRPWSVRRSARRRR
jgi:hypothetical protein